MKEADYETLSRIFNALSTKERIVALEMFDKGKMKLTDVAEVAGMSRSGFQNVIDDFRDTKLVKQAEHRSYYRLSSKGEKVLSMVEKLSGQLAPLEEKIKRQQLKASITKFGAGLTEEDIKEIFREVKEDEK